jgi:hypothetical protein
LKPTAKTAAQSKRFMDDPKIDVNNPEQRAAAARQKPI